MKPTQVDYMKLDLKKYYICWSPRILAEIEKAGFELWKDPEGKQENPFYDIKKRYINGEPSTRQCWGYIYERDLSLMELVTSLSHNKKD